MPDQKTIIRQFLEQIRDERMTSANTATRIGRAFIMLLDYLSGTDAPYIRKDMADSTPYLLQMLAGAVIGDSATLLKANGEIVTQLLQAMVGIESPLAVHDDIESTDFEAGEEGYRIAENGNGKFEIEIDIANIRNSIDAALAHITQADIGEVISPIVFNRLVTMLQGVVVNVLESSDYSQGIDGYKIYKQQNGRYILEISDLEVFGKMVVHELEVRKESYSGGNHSYSHAGSHIVRVEEVRAGITVSRDGHVLHLSGAIDRTGTVLHVSGGTRDGNVLHLSQSSQLYAYRCFLKADDGTMATANWWRLNDQARCQTFNLDGRGKYQNIQNSYYWRRVVKIGMETLEDGLLYDYIDLSAGDAVDGSTVPTAGDDIVQVGNRTDTERQGLLSFEVYGRYAPAFKVYRGINGYTLEGKMKICISPKYTELRLQKFVIETEYDAQQVPMERGPWEKIKDHKCYYYDLVQHRGSTWLCIYPESGINGILFTTEEPSAYATYWEVYAAGGKDGSDGKSFNILGSYDTESQLIAAHPTGEVGQAYMVNGYLYIWDEINTRWQNAGRIQGDPGNGVRSVTISYGVSSSATDYPTDWVSNPASLPLTQGSWFFTRMVFNYTNGQSSQPSYSIAYFGQDGRYKSIVFARTNKDLSNASLTGGTYNNPIPNSIVVDGETVVFYDGDPGGESVLWSTSDIFRPDNTHTGWTTPRRMSDTATFDVEFSPNETKPADPSNTESERTAQGWYDPTRNPTHDFSTTIWRAERHKKNGVWGAWAIEKVKGEKGDKGDSITIDLNNSYMEYALSDYGVAGQNRDYPSDITSWSRNRPEPVQGKFLWTKDVTAYLEGTTPTSTVTYGVTYFGIDGGSVAIDTTRTFVKYSTQKGASKPADNTFTLTDPPTMSPGDYLWILSQTAYIGIDTPLKSYSVSRVGADGSDGDPGTDGYTTHFAYATSADGSQGFSTTNFNGATYIGTYRDTNAADSTDYRDYTWTQWKGNKGDKGDKGDSVAIDNSNSSTMYCVSNQGSTPPSSGWQVSRPSATKGQYIWSRVITAYTDGNSTTVYGCEYIPNDGADGQDGTSVTIVGTPSTTYCLTQSSTQPADSQFTLSSIPALTLGYYLWSKTVINYSDGNSVKQYGVSRLGTDGTNGVAGADGYTTHFAYATSADGSQSFSTTNFDGATYIGTYRDRIAADSTDYRDYTWTQWKGNKGDDGADGKDSATGYTTKSAIVIETDTEGRVLKDFSEEVGLGMYVNADDLTVTQVTVAEDTPRYVNTDRHLLVIHRNSTAYRSGSVLHTSDITERVGSVLHIGGEDSSFVTVPRVVARKSQLLDEHIVKLSMKAIDADGTEYQGRAYFQILRNYVAENGQDGHTGADGRDGTNGENAIMLYFSPANVIITQTDQEDGNGNYPIDLTNAFTDIRLMAGENDITSRATVKSVTPSSVTISGQDRATCTVTRSGQRITITALGTRADAAQGETPQYFEAGYVTIIMTYNDIDYEARFNFLCNLLGSFKQRIVGDMQQIFATKTQYQQLANNALMKSEWDAKYEQSSQGTVAQLAKIVAITGVNGENIFTQQQQALYAQTVSENISELKSKVDNGKNLMPSANGWVGNNGSASTVSYGGRFAINDTSNDLYSPVVKLEKNTTYCFSADFDINPVNDSAYALSTTKYANGYEQYTYGTTDTPVWHTEGNRRYFSFRTGNSDVYFVFNFYPGSQTVLYRPQLEKGETPTEFEASSYEVSSLIKQVADAIELKVSDKVSTSVFNQTAQSLQTQVNGKASSSELTQTAESLQSQINGKASSSELTQTASAIRSEISSGLSGKVDTSTFNQTVNGINAKVNSRSKNLLDCANGEGWRNWYDNSLADYDSTKQKIIGSDCYSTAVYLKAGVTYVFSFYGQIQANVMPFRCGGDPDVDSNVDGDDQLTDLELTQLSETYENVPRHYGTFTPQNTGYYKFDIYDDELSCFYRPQIELGNGTPTDWEPGGRNTEGHIQVAADNVRLGVKNALSQAGINIDAHTIQLYGDKVTFSNADGTVNNLVSIDPETGALHAVDGVFEGSLLFHKVVNGKFYSNLNNYIYLYDFAWYYDESIGDNVESVPVKLKGDILIVSGNTYNCVSRYYDIYLPPADSFRGAQIKIVNGTYQSTGTFQRDKVTIRMYVNHPRGTEQRAEDVELIAKNHFFALTPFTWRTGFDVHGHLETLEYDAYDVIELVSTQNPYHPEYYVWMVITTQEY